MTHDAPPVWLNGHLVSAADAVISVFDHGLTVGDGLFETMRVTGGRPFALRRHLERLARTAAALELSIPDRSYFELAIAEVIETGGMAEARLRITVTGGVAPLGSGRGDGPPNVVVAIAALPPERPSAAVVIVPWPRNERGATAGLKTTSYAENVIALAHAARHGGDEAIFANTVGNLCEGSGSNLVVGIAGRLVTPPLSAGCLAGVTRDLLLLAVPDIAEEDLAVSALRDADEAFLLSSVRDVQPIDSVDGAALGASPGPLTRAAMTAFAELRRTAIDP
ncbi:MAG: aminotransferase class IV [Actinobacteria bacterium]|nr:aminotransferase class IV [Actinomycetota bacterium]